MYNSTIYRNFTKKEDDDMKAVVFLNGEYTYSQEFIDSLLVEETVLICADGGAN